jgi:membrane protease YdiL (CAAX protease family)
VTTADLAAPAPAETAEPRPFGPIAAILLVALVFGGTVVFAFATGIIVGMLHVLGNSADSGSIGMQRFEWAVQGLTSVLIVLSILGIAGLRAGRRFGELLALNVSFPKWVSLTAFGLTVATMAYETALEGAVPGVKELVEQYLVFPSDRVSMWFAAFALVIGAPVSEELTFRGFLYTSFRKKWGYVPALVVTSVLFSAMHFEGTGLYALLVLPSAFLFGWARERSGGIALPIGMHALINFGAVIDNVWGV